MEERGMSTVADILLTALMVSVACGFLIQGIPSNIDGKTEVYAHRAAQNTLLSMQKISVREITNFSYSEDLPAHFLSRKRNLDRKTISQLIKKDIIFNPNREKNSYSQELNIALRKFLEKNIGERYGYRLIIKLKPTQILLNKNIDYRKVIENIGEGSRKLCSETVNWLFTVPRGWLGEDLEIPSDVTIENGLWVGLPVEMINNRLVDSQQSDSDGGSFRGRKDFLEIFQKHFSFFGKYGILKVTLELWSK